MSLIAMDWKGGKPPANFVGFAIEYQEPKGHSRFYMSRQGRSKMPLRR
jgi:hypothetical protein